MRSPRTETLKFYPPLLLMAHLSHGPPSMDQPATGEGGPRELVGGAGCAGRLEIGCCEFRGVGRGVGRGDFQNMGRSQNLGTLEDCERERGNAGTRGDVRGRRAVGAAGPRRKGRAAPTRQAQSRWFSVDMILKSWTEVYSRHHQEQSDSCPTPSEKTFYSTHPRKLGRKMLQAPIPTQNRCSLGGPTVPLTLKATTSPLRFASEVALWVAVSQATDFKTVK